jgi:Family of unknown function (DUF6510)
MNMDERELRLDGNAVAGLLAEVFRTEATTAVVTCAGCGMTGAVGTVQAYVQTPGTVLRCPVCEAVLMRFARTPSGLHADLRGARALVLNAP